MPSLDGVNATPQFTDLQFGYNDLIPIYDLSERVPKATTFRDLLKALGYKGTSIIDALRVYKANNSASGEPPINDQYFTQTDGTDTTSTLTYNADCWAARFDLTGTAWHAPTDNGHGARRAHLIGPKAVTFADHYPPNGPMTFTNAQGQRFTYSLATGTVNSNTENLLTYSETFMNNPFVRWSLSSGSATSLSSTVTDPLGYGIPVWKLTGGDTHAYAVVYRAISGLSTGTVYNISCHFKKGTSDLIRLGLYDNNTPPNLQYLQIAFDSEGVPSTSESSDGVGYIQYTPVGTEGWYRCSFAVSALNVDGSQTVAIYPDRSASSKFVYAFGAQVSTGSSLKKYQETEASAITSGVTYQATHALGNDAKIGVLSASVDTSLRLYEVETSVQAGEFLLATRSRQSSTTDLPVRQRVQFTQAHTSYGIDSATVALRQTSESSSSAFQSYMDDSGPYDSSDGTFTIDDNNIPKLVSTNHTVTSSFTNGPFYGFRTRLRDMDDFLSAWSTTREGRAPY
tara:strand:- start:230 stop:1765 length:1536 start_codon:yes stop_codon:yes gene_type:complete